ncbi:MAG: hypothetical protein PHT88_05460 [Candidatus Moranbacteria bacterium]|nr:hypothetical protein [Candidatus Moranbacteria bacterium]
MNKDKNNRLFLTGILLIALLAIAADYNRDTLAGLFRKPATVESPALKLPTAVYPIKNA